MKFRASVAEPVQSTGALLTKSITSKKSQCTKGLQEYTGVGKGLAFNLPPLGDKDEYFII